MYLLTIFFLNLYIYIYTHSKLDKFPMDAGIEPLILLSTISLFIYQLIIL